jgi:hypothetical protein
MQETEEGNARDQTSGSGNLQQSSSFTSGSAANAGMMFVSTKSARGDKSGHSTAEVIASISPKRAQLMFIPNGGLVAAFEPPAVQGVGSYGLGSIPESYDGMVDLLLVLDVECFGCQDHPCCEMRFESMPSG